MNYFKLAWRNIWRNKRRTIITAASIAFAVFYATLMRSVQIGIYDRQITNTVELLAGYIQIHSKGYSDDNSLDNSFPLNDSLLATIEANGEIKASFPRIRDFSLASTGVKSKPAMVMGINPELEADYSAFNRQISDGEYITNNDSSVVIGEGLASFLDIVTFDTTYTKTEEGIDTIINTRIINDTIILIGQGYHGISAMGKYKVKGVVKVPLPDINRNLILMPLPLAQDHFSLDSNVTSLMIMLDNLEKTDGVVAEIQSKLNRVDYEILPWYESMFELMQQIKADEGGNFIMLYILYLIVGFGIFGTVLMMAKERQKEFGVMNAVGMQKIKITTLTSFELLLMAFIGVIVGIAMSMPIITYFHYNPIPLTGEMAQAMDDMGWEAVIDFALKPGFIINQGIVIFILVIISSIYPLLKIRKMSVIKALRS